MKRQMFGIIVGVSALFMANGLVAEEKVLVKWGTDAPALKKAWNGRIKYEDVDGKFCGVVDNKTYITSKKFFPIQAGKKYTLSGTFKSLGDKTSQVYYGFITYDKKKRQINPYNSNIISGSATVLAQACKKGDKTLVIKANKKWRPNYAVAFNVKDDFSDLPNYEVIYKVAKVVPKGDNMELQLSAAVKKAYPAGTKVREHTTAYGSYLYTTVTGAKIPKTWKTYSNSAVLAKPGQMSHQFFRPGTAFVKILILPNYAKKKDEKIAFTALSLKVAE
jgi:hypothetical protein